MSFRGFVVLVWITVAVEESPVFRIVFIKEILVTDRYVIQGNSFGELLGYLAFDIVVNRSVKPFPMISS